MSIEDASTYVDEIWETLNGAGIVRTDQEIESAIVDVQSTYVGRGGGWIPSLREIYGWAPDWHEFQHRVFDYLDIDVEDALYDRRG